MTQVISNLSVGSKIKFGKYQIADETAQDIIWTIVAKDHNSTPAYPSNSITLFADHVIDVRAVDGAEPNNTDDRQTSGNNHYSVSNIDQWLNKDDNSNNWYIAAHILDAPPDNSNLAYKQTGYTTRPGFLKNFTEDEKNAILTTNIRVNQSLYDGASYEDIARKVYLPAMIELGLDPNENEYSIYHSEGKDWGYLQTTASRIGSLSTQAKSYSKSTVISGKTSWGYVLRTPFMWVGHQMWEVTATGTPGYRTCNDDSAGIRPVMNITNTLDVSDTVDEDNCYVVIWNAKPNTPESITVPAKVEAGKTITISWSSVTGTITGYILEQKINGNSWTQVYKGSNTYTTISVNSSWNTVQYRACAYRDTNRTSDYVTSDIRTVIHNTNPVISGSDGDLGTKTAEFSQTYTVTQADSIQLSVEESIDNVIIRTYTTTLNTINAIQITNGTWLGLLSGTHSIKIKITDAYGQSSVRNYTFKKTFTGIDITNSIAYPSTTLPTKIKISVDRYIAEGSSFTVYACNNGFDSSPNWEDCTQSVINESAYTFNNTITTYGTYGVKVRVVVGKGTASQTSYINSIGGNFQ